MNRYNTHIVETMYSFYFFSSKLVLHLMNFEFDFYFEVTCLLGESISLLLGFAAAEIVTSRYLSEIINIRAKTQVLHMSFPNLELNST